MKQTPYIRNSIQQQGGRSLMKDFGPKGQWIPDEFIRLPMISHLDRMVLSCVYALDDNGCTACDAYIADKTCLTPRQVRRSLSKMYKVGYLEFDCKRGEGILGTQRKIYCKILVKTIDRNRAVVHPTTIPKAGSGFDQKRAVVCEPTQSVSMPKSHEFNSNIIDTSNNNIIYSTENEIKHEEQFQTMELKPKVGSDLLERLKEVVKEKHLMLGFGDEQLSTLSAFDEESLVICMRAASESCKGTRLSWNYYRKIVENNGQAKKVKKPTLASQFKFERKLFVI